MADNKTIAHKFVATNTATSETVEQYVQPELARVLYRILDEEGYDEITEEEVTEVPEGAHIIAPKG